MKKRSEYLDCVKGFAIFLVVLGHCIQYGSGSEVLKLGLFFNDSLFKFIYTFHMPLFMLVSGYLFYQTVQCRPAKQVLMIKIKSILLPLIAWHSVYLVFSCIFDKPLPINIAFYSYFHVLWFLRALFFCCMLILFVRFISLDIPTTYLIITLALHFVPNNIIPDVFVFTTPYFILGYLFHQFKGQLYFSKLSKYRKMSYCMMSGIIFLILFLFFENNYYVYVSKTFLFQKDSTISFMFFVNIYRHLAAIFGCIFILSTIWFSYKYLNRRIITVFVALSQSSLCIYIINHYMNETIIVHLPNTHINYLVSLLMTTGVIFVGYSIFWLLKQRKISRILFLGGR